MRTPHGFVALASVCYLFGALALVQAFQQPVPQAVPKQFTTGSQPSPIRSSFQSSPRSPALGPLYFWGNKNKDDESTESETSKSNDGETKEEGDSGTRKSFFPFFANSQTTKEESKVEEKKEEPPVVTAVAVEAPTRPRVVAKKEKLDPVEEAKSLRAQAERARLEADKMDAELTLRKITKLEKDIASAMAKEDTDKDVESLQREIDALQAKMRGETPKPVVIPKREEKSAAAAETVLSTILDASSSSPKLTVVGGGSTYERDEALNFQVFPDLSDTDFEGLVQTVEKAPGFMKKLFAQMTEIDFIGPDDINATEVATRLYQIQRADFSFSKRPKPTFTKQQIDEAIKEKTFEDGIMQALDEKLTATVKGNETAKALLALEYNYYVEEYDMSKMSKLIDGEDWLKGIVDAVNKTQVDSSIEILYPKCTRKEDAETPTMAQIKMLMSDVLPKASFSPRGQPEQVAGGYIVRGTSKFDSGAETINAIDKQLEKSVLKEKMTVLYTKDFTLFAGSTDFELPDPDEEPPILYVMGPDITPERKRIPLSIITSVGIATSWYLSVYPFLLNPTILKRTEEQLELADASMAYDLSWLTELSLPLFLTFIGIQMAHEAGHKLLGGVNGVSNSENGMLLWAAQFWSIGKSLLVNRCTSTSFTGCYNLPHICSFADYWRDWYCYAVQRAT